MRRPCRHGNLLGYVLIALGLIILLSMFLPAGFWWFVLGTGFLCAGLALVRRRC